ncbi:hypothetical protein CE91St24_03340 [Odoribacteraceae bacterium]|uniref:thioredoxin family protein n=2 Tax=Odoribacteraceae TaxID=1853231 RepID=UPI002084672C|nr:thioredoxin family protein [Butyricimonas paravirosa]BDF56659.1 hypothetical protein CE91St21_40940 [Odoribacteraceae bacterium]GKH95523.1 hypothetical protein CE91St23_40190 [Odoribacteraceae bacterium]GKH98147.1 hypothetical protein CE91St22_20250 [Odoribacteraceae bacterium]GKI01059.1 hypothetical protein CE91St24_03340 [Odoribacteraceae bacterium]
MKALYFSIVCFFLLGGNVSGQGIRFFEGSLDQALEVAKKEGKLVFVDFYADWCGPCKQLAKEVFSKDEVGVYYNEKFISVKVNTEDATNKTYVRKYKVSSLPTLVFMQADGKLISSVSGTMGVDDFIVAGRVAAGEEMSFEALYSKYKSNSKDLNLLQQLLERAPGFVGIQEKAVDKQKWITRVEDLYKKYIDKKPIEEMVNKDDFRIIRTFHKIDGQEDPFLEKMIDHLAEYKEKVGNAPAGYLLEYNNKIMSRLARAGKMEYKKYLDRVNGDLKLAYDLMPERAVSPYDRIRYMYEGEYLIYYKKDVKAYMDLQEEYIHALGKEANDVDYGSAVQTLYEATGGKISNEWHEKASQWIVEALKTPNVPLMNKLNLIVLLGDASRELGKYDEAKKCYNQAFMESMQLEHQMTQRGIQMSLKRKLAKLDLLKK